MVQNSKRRKRGYSEKSPNPVPIHPAPSPQTTVVSKNLPYRYNPIDIM